MELRQLEYFIELCKVRNFTKASENLHVAQPAVTKSIQKLEEELGVQLINRNQKPLGLTKAGERFYHRVEEVMTLLQDAVAEATDSTSIRRALTIGISTMSGVLLDEMLTDEDAVAQGIFYNIINRGHLTIIDLLLRGELDIGLVINRDLPPELTFIPLETQQALCLMPEDSPLLEKDVLTFSDLRNQQFCMAMEHNHSIVSQMVYERCVEAGYTPPGQIFVQNYHPNTRLSVEWVRRGYGISFMPEHSARRSKGIAYRSVTPPLSFEIGLAYRKNDKISIQLRKLITYVQSRYPGYAKEIRENAQIMNEFNGKNVGNDN